MCFYSNGWKIIIFNYKLTIFISLYIQTAFGYHTRILFQARQILESEYSTLLRDGTDRQQLGVAAMDGNTSSSPS